MHATESWTIMKTMQRITATIALVVAMGIGASVSADAARTSPGCKVLSVHTETQTFAGLASPGPGIPTASDATVVTTTTSSRCRGKIVVTTVATVQYQR